MKTFLISSLRITMRMVRAHPWLATAIALCAFMFFTFRADANVTRNNKLNNDIRDLQQKWREADSDIAACAKPHKAKQEELHEAANKIRDELCDTGSFEHCTSTGSLMKAKEKFRKSLPQYEVNVTSYNPVAAQTDASPCVGAAGVDLCKINLNGRPIALSQDLVGRAPWKPFKYHDQVYMESDVPQCNGWFVVLDTMNARWSNKADIFNMYRKDNTSCKATIYKVSDKVSMGTFL